MHRLGLVLWLLLYICVAYASPKEDASAKRKTGDKMMAEGAFEEALKSYDEAKAIFADPELDLSRGDALLKLRRYEESKASYQTYLDTSKNKKGKNDVKKAIEDIDRILRTFLDCQSEPEGATIYLNSRVDGQIGPTPLSFHLPPGTHRVIFVKQGFKTKTETIVVNEGDKATLRTKLEVAPFTLEVSTSPGNAEILIDGLPAGKSPAALELSDGAHEVELRLEGFQALSQQVTGKSGEAIPLAHSFIENPSLLLLTASPIAEGTFVITGRELTGRLGEPLALPPGKYNVVVSALGYKEAATAVTIEKAKTTESQITLEPFPVRLLVKANVPSFAVALDDTPQALAVNSFELPPGKHKLKISAAGYNDYQAEIELKAGEPISLEAQLRAAHKASTYALAGVGLATEVAGLSVGTAALIAVRQRNNEAGDCPSCDLSLITERANKAQQRAKTADALYKVGLIPALIVLPLAGYRYFIKEGPSKATITKLPPGNP